MESLKFNKSYDGQGQVSTLEISGMLVVENSQQLKKEFVDVFYNLGDRFEVIIDHVQEIDLSCIQLFVAFIGKMEEASVGFNFDWNLDEDQRSFIENVGLSKVLFINSLYA